MASGATFHAKITADAREFIAQVEGAQEALKNLIQETKGAGKAAKSGTGSNASKAKKEQQSAQREAMRAGDAQHQKELQNIKKESQARKESAKQEADERRRQEKIAEGLFKARLVREGRSARVGEQIAWKDESLRGQRAEGPARDVKDLIRLQRQYLKPIKQEEEHQRKIAFYNRQQLDAMVTGRYALYDMANAYQQIAYNAFRVAQAVGFAVANTAKFESAFTAVERAAMLDNTTESFEYFRQSLIDLSTQLPITFEEISNIATLGAQMGVATGNLEQFTRTIAAFSSITGASIDETAERFGRISALAKVPVDEFENLASSVLFAGFNAVATEQEILSMAESIAAAAANAGYSAKQVIGLATALSSLGIAPEQARGVILRVFNTITRAIEGSTDKLAAFAQAAGVSAEEAQYLWKESPEEFFTSLLGGLSTVEELTLALDELGITNTREINVIQRLSGNMDVYSKSLEEASQAYEEGSALQDIYSKTADNLETKVVQLQNAFTALQAAAGEGMAEALKPAVDLLIRMTRAATEFASSPIGSLILPAVGVIASLAAAFAGVQFVSKIATAQLLAMRVAILKTGQAGLSGTNIFRGLIDALRGNVFVSTELGGRLEFLTKKQVEARVASGLFSQEVGNNIIATGRASRGVAALSAAMSGLGIALTAASVIGIGAMIYNMNKMQNAVGSNVGGVKALAEAIGRDTEAYKKGGDAIATHTVEINKNASATKDSANNSSIIIGAQGDIAEQFDETSEAIMRQTAALGENFKQLLLQDIQESDALENLFENLKNQGSDINDLFRAMGFTIADFVDAAAADPEAGAFDLLSEGLQNLEDNMDSLDEKTQIVARDLLKMARLDGTLQQNDLQAFLNGLAGNATDLLRLITQTETGIANSSVYIAQDLGRIVQSVQDGVRLSIEQYEILKALGLQFNETTNSLETYNDEQDNGANSADNLSKALRTVLDYASDLDGIFGRVIDLEFSKIIGRDEIAEGWQKIADNANKAADAIEKAEQTQKDLAADKTILEYQLSVAERYGDEARAAQIRAKLADVNSNLAKAEEDLAEAKEKTNKSLRGDSEVSRENRAELLGVISNYKNYIKTLAELGRKPEQLAGDIDVLRRQFREQALAAGYAESELAPYLELFEQFGRVTSEAPRDVDIEVALGLDAAEQAINEFLAKKRSMGVDVEVEADDAETSWEKRKKELEKKHPKLYVDITPAELEITNLGLAWDRRKAELEKKHPKLFLDITPAEKEMQEFTETEYRPNIVADRLATAEAGAYLRNWANAASNSLKIEPVVKPKVTKDWIYEYAQQLLKIRKYDEYRLVINAWRSMATGGFVSGPGGPTDDRIPAMLSNGEYVIQASAVSAYGVDFMNALNSQRIPMAASAPAAAAVSGGSTIAYLAPEDRALLRAVADRPVALYADNTKIAQSANAGNQTLTQRGLK